MNDPDATTRPTAAGMYDFYLGGTAHTPIDRAAAEAILQVMPDIADGASANRGFLQRAVHRMVTEFGITQFLDVGAGLPTQRNTHDVVAELTSDGRVVYVDIDPMVVARARELLTGNDQVAVLQADVRQAEAILEHPETRAIIDFSQPVGLLFVALLHFVPDDDDPWGLVRRYMDALPSGSCLALSHGSMTHLISDDARELGAKVYQNTDNPPTDRSRTEIERFFAGLELVPPYDGAAPGIAHIGLWGAEDPSLADSDGSRLGYAGLGRKP